MFINNIIRSRIALALLTVPFTAVCGTAWAQDADGEEANVLEEVIVTAQKREQSIQEIPISIKALMAETLATVNADSLDEITRLVPSLSMTDLSRGGNNVQIRGLGSNVGNVGTVAIFNDGVISAGRIQSSGTFAEQDSALYDVERIEVLRGPQGTLYGEGSFGGVINIISKRPNAEKFEASGSVTWFDTKRGTGDNWDFSGMVNMPIVSDTLALRMVAFSYDHDGYIDLVDVFPLFLGQAPQLVATDANTEEVTGGRAMLGWTPNEDLEATLIYKTESLDIGISNYDSPDLINTVNALAGTSFKPEYTQAAFSPDFGSSTDTDELILDINYQTPIGTLTSISGWGQIDQNNAAGLEAETDAFSQELRLSSDSDGKLNWIVGAYYRDAERDIAITGVGPYNTNALKQWSVFGQAYWQFTSSLTGTFGLRYGKYKTSSADLLYGLAPVKETFDDVSPKFALDWLIDDNTLWYVSVAKGFRAGGTNVDQSVGTDPAFIAGFEPDKIWNYEVGVKTGLFNDKVTLNAALFYVDWTDIQIDKAITSLISPPYQFIVTNGQDAHSYGIEADVFINPAEGWEIVLGGSLVEAEFDNGTIDSATQGLDFPLKGQRLANSPEYLANASLERYFPFADKFEGYARFDYSLRGSSFADVPNEAPPGGDFRSGKMTNMNLRAGVRWANWDIQAFVTNLTDEYASSFNYYDGGFADLHVIVRPRTYGINVKFNY
jgi:outer membrane receptor protein involved in Fe transport